MPYVVKRKAWNDSQHPLYLLHVDGAIRWLVSKRVASRFDRSAALLMVDRLGPAVTIEEYP